MKVEGPFRLGVVFKREKGCLGEAALDGRMANPSQRFRFATAATLTQAGVGIPIMDIIIAETRIARRAIATKVMVWFPFYSISLPFYAKNSNRQTAQIWIALRC